MERRSTVINIPLAQFTNHALASGGISARGIMLLMLYYIKLILVIPGSLLQNIFYSKKIRETIITKPPIFILGHYRSGTTYLHKLIAYSERFGLISYYDILCPNTSLLFGRWLQKLLQFIITKFKVKTAFFNNSIPSLEEPAEEERFLINKGSAYTDYWRFVFPQCWSKWRSCAQQCLDENYYKQWSRQYLHVLKLATFKHKNKQLILKSPQNTERIKYLLKMFPDAKFIYISRNPYHVYYSMINLWNKAIKKFCLQKISDEQIEKIVFSHYSSLLDQYEKDKNLIPADNLIEINYEELEYDPLNIVKRIYDELSIPCFRSVQQKLKQKIEKEKHYRTFEYEYSNSTFCKIEKQWAKYIEQWNKNKSKKETIVASYSTVQECDATNA